MASKSLYLFKSYANFAEWVDFASGVAPGRVCTCSLRSRLVWLKEYHMLSLYNVNSSVHFIFLSALLYSKHYMWCDVCVTTIYCPVGLCRSKHISSHPSLDGAAGDMPTYEKLCRNLTLNVVKIAYFRSFHFTYFINALKNLKTRINHTHSGPELKEFNTFNDNTICFLHIFVKISNIDMYENISNTS